MNDPKCLKSRFRKNFLYLSVLLAGSASIAPIWAAELEEIVVTAQRRAQNIQDVGLVVNQFSSDDLREIGAVDTTDLAQFVPGLYVSGAYGGQSQQFTIRGVTQSDYLDTIENPVAFYIDEVYITSAQGQTMSFFDLDRVEVLKGPQGTLFGRNATGGLVHTIIAKPDLEKMGGYVDLSYGKYDEQNIQGALNLPISDTLALRVSGLSSQIDSYWDNIYPNGGAGSNTILSFDGPGGNSQGVVVTPNGDDLGASETIAGRLQLLFNPNDALNVRLTSSYAKTEMSSAPYTEEATIATVDAQGRVIGSSRVSPDETRIAIGPGGVNVPEFVPLANGIFVRPAPGGDFFGYVAPDPDSLKLSEDYAKDDLNEVESSVHALHIAYDFGSFVLDSITSIQDFKKEVYLGDGSAAPVLAFAAKSKTDAWSQEIRLSGETDDMRWQTGVFYLDNKTDLLQGILETSGSALAGIGTFITGDPTLVEFGNDLVNEASFTSESWSVFGQVEYDFMDKWTAIVGLRYINEDQTYDYRHFNALNLDNYKVEGSVFLFPAFQPDYDDSRSDDLWAGKVQLEYRPNQNWLLYAGVNRGIKAGNYNAPFTFSPADTVPASAMSYKPEELLSYEGGFKFTNDRWRLNSSVFYYDYSDFQAFVFTTASGVVRNVDSEVYGVDIEAAVQISDALSLGINFAYSHAQIDDFEIAPGIFNDVRPPYSPRTQAGANLNYVVPANIFDGQLSFNVATNYAGKIYHNIRNFEAHEFDSRTLVNLSATWHSNTNGFSVTAFGKNVTDERYGQIGFDNTVVFGGQNVSFGKPRSYGISVHYDF